MGFTFYWILICITVALTIVLSWYFATDFVGTKEKIRNVAITVGIGVLFCGLMIWSLYFTESGKRTQKTFRSETSGGLYRTVRVYDMEGELLEAYEGKFDVDEYTGGGITKVKFDSDGKRHIIYCSTGTVIIDEVEPSEEDTQ